VSFHRKCEITFIFEQASTYSLNTRKQTLCLRPICTLNETLHIHCVRGMKMCFFAENVKVSLFQFLGELESKIENVLGCYSKAQMDLKSTEIP
jgi:hypothetical protein